MAMAEIRFDSQILGLSLGANILLPENPAAWETPPAVLYLLHGLSDDHTIWCRRTSIERYARNYPLAIVMPDAYKSFYCNMAHGSDYLTFVADELPMLVQRWFNIDPAPERTFVAGLSMGGYGAMKLAIERPGRYAAAASLSGALNLAAHLDDDFDRAHQRTFEAVFGNLRALAGSANDLIARLAQKPDLRGTALYLCCGTEDYLYEDSLSFLAAARAAGLHPTWEDSSGGHTWDYWDRQIRRVLEWLPVEPIQSTDGSAS